VQILTESQHALLLSHSQQSMGGEHRTSGASSAGSNNTSSSNSNGNNNVAGTSMKVDSDATLGVVKRDRVILRLPPVPERKQPQRAHEKLELEQQQQQQHNLHLKSEREGGRDGVSGAGAGGSAVTDDDDVYGVDDEDDKVRLEISINSTIADAFGIPAYSRVVMKRVQPPDLDTNFVEFVFRRQYLQRGHIWRFNRKIVGSTVHIGQNVSVDGVQATVQELANGGVASRSGIISDTTQVIFRSRSTRVIWLVQISLELWDFDPNGDLYYEKFLHKFVSPLLDRWQALNTTHQLSVMFFSRTYYTPSEDEGGGDDSNNSNNNESRPWSGVGRSDHNHQQQQHPAGKHDQEDYANSSKLHTRADGALYRDHFKVVIGALRYLSVGLPATSTDSIIRTTNLFPLLLSFYRKP
jgi:hypothetical protein